MKTNRYSFLTAAAIICFSILACNKEKEVTPSSPIIIPPPPPPPSVIQNSTTLVWIWQNQYVAVPADSAMLSGYTPLNNNNISYLWRKIAGPASYNIQNPDSLKTKVNHLAEGEYQFEITATNAVGTTSRDTMYVYVIKPGSNEVIFKNLQWGCPMGCSISIPNISAFIPNRPFNVSIRSDGSSTWAAAIPVAQWNGSDDFVYGIDSLNNTLGIYVNDATTAIVHVRIQY